MKRARKLITFILAAVMVLSMSMNVMAETGTYGETKGTITISDPDNGIKYSAYQILKLESFDTDAGAYLYTVTDEWRDWLNGNTIKGVFIQIDPITGYVTWIENADPAEFAKLAMEEAASKQPTETVVASNGNAVMNNLELGYYLVDSSQGALCSLNTTKAEAVIEEKNEAPTSDKQVENKSTSTYGDSNTASIGDVVDYKVIITVKDGAKGYALHDEMSEGLTYDPSSLKIQVSEVDVAVENYSHKYATAAEVENKPTDACDFEIIFNDDYLAGLAKGTQIIVTYSAKLNENAIIAGTGNTNDSYLEYGEKVDVNGDGTPDDKPKTPDDSTKTYTYKFDLVKTDKDNKVITGATFALYDAATGGNLIGLVKEGDIYRIATKEEAEDPGFVSAVIEAGETTIEGLGNGLYYLAETAAPQGYNPITTRKEVEINGANLDANVSDNVYADGGVEVENLTGSILPSTGGIGTTIFYIVGGALVLFAVVLLVTKKRMKDNQ